MKKVVSLVVACVSALVMLCGCDTQSGDVTDNKPPAKTPVDIADLNVNGEVNELMSVEELVDFHLNGNKYPENYVLEELSACDYLLNSASSQEEALALAKKKFGMSGDTIVEIRLIAETNLLYGIYLKCSYYSVATKQTIYYDYCLISFKKEVYDAESKKFITKDKDEIKTILNYLYHCHSYRTGGTKVYSADIAVKDGKCEYTAYLLMVSFGDWNVQDHLYLVRTECYVDLATGAMTYTYEEVGSVYIDGDLTHISGVEAYD